MDILALDLFFEPVREAIAAGHAQILALRDMFKNPFAAPVQLQTNGIDIPSINNKNRIPLPEYFDIIYQSLPLFEDGNTVTGGVPIYEAGKMFALPDINGRIGIRIQTFLGHVDIWKEGEILAWQAPIEFVDYHFLASANGIIHSYADMELFFGNDQQSADNIGDRLSRLFTRLAKGAFAEDNPQ